MNNYDDQIESLALNPLSFSPISIIGNIGSGKTLFLEKFRSQRQKIYKPAFGDWSECEGAKIFNADEILKAFVDSVRSNNNSWKEMFSAVDLIIIDDFDKLHGKTATQEALFSYFLTCQKAIILSSKSEIIGEGFSEEISSFLSTGARIYIDDPDKESKLNFLITGLCTAGMLIENDALEWLSNQNFISYAATKGYVKTLQLFATEEPLSLADCIKCSKGYIY